MTRKIDDIDTFKHLDNHIDVLIKKYKNMDIFYIPSPTEKMQELLHLMWNFRAYDAADIKIIKMDAVSEYCKEFPEHRNGEDIENLLKALDDKDDDMIKLYRHKLKNIL